MSHFGHCTTYNRCCIPHDQAAQNSISSPSKNRWIEEIIISSEEHIYLLFYNSSLISRLGFRTELYFVLPSILETSYKPRVDVTRVLRKWMDLVSFFEQISCRAELPVSLRPFCPIKHFALYFGGQSSVKSSNQTSRYMTGWDVTWTSPPGLKANPLWAHHH